MAVLTKKLSAVIANAIAPYLEKYLPLTGGTLTGSIFRFSGRYPYFINTYSDSNDNKGGFYFFSKATGTPENTLDNALLRINANGTLDNGDSGGSLGSNGRRWPTVYGVDGDFSGNLTAKTINGVSAASLVSLDDLKEVLTTQQIAKLEAKVNQRIAIAKVSDI